MRKILECCPACAAPLTVAELRCERCETTVRGRFRSCDFCALTEEQAAFLRLFVLSRGNLSEVEKRLGISYPTVRAKVDEIVQRIQAAEAPRHPTDRRAILEAVQRGEIPVADATRLIQALGEEE